MKNRQFTKHNWIYWFKKYESGNFDWNDYYKVRKPRKTTYKSLRNIRYRFIRMYRIYMNGRRSIINNMTGKAKVGRPKKPVRPDWSKWNDDEKNEVLNQLWDLIKELTKKQRMTWAKKTNITVQKKAELFNLSRSGIYKSFKKLAIKHECNAELYSANPDGTVSCYAFKTERPTQNKLWAFLIASSFYKNNKIYGRLRIANDIYIKYGVNISERSVGYYMEAMELKCKTRVARKKQEIKNTKVKIPDLVKRNYNMRDVLATDISYIAAKSNFSNHLYLSVAINHYTKYIEAWELGEHNDINLVINTLKQIKPQKNLIIHSDHGVQYSTKSVTDLIKQKKAISSMSRVGNSLDNREAEYFFSNIKSEKLKHLPTHQMTYSELKAVVTEYIEWYNNERIQKRLGWKSPAQFKSQEWFIPKTANNSLSQDYIY